MFIDRPTVIYLDYFEDLSDALPYINKIRAGLKQPPVIISSNLDNNVLSEHTGCKVIYFDEFMSKEDYEFLDEYAFGLTQTWYSGLPRSEGLTVHNGIEFGKITEERAQRFFIFAIKNLEILLKIAEKIRPAKIVLIGAEDIFPGLCKFAKGELGIASLFVRASCDDRSVKAFIKRVSLKASDILSSACDYLMQKAMLREKMTGGILIECRLYSEIIRFYSSLGKAEFKFHPYPYLIGKGLKKRLELLKKDGLFFVPLSIACPHSLMKLFNRDFRRYWRCLEKENGFKDKFRYKKLRIWPVLKNFIGELVICDFSNAKRNVIFLEKVYKRLKPRLIVLREAVRGPERTIVFTARKTGIKTMVIQHGILAARNVYVELYPDKIALWGEAGKDWYASHNNNDPSRCTVTGKSRHDLLCLRGNEHKKHSREAFLKIGANPDAETVLYIANDFKNLRYSLSSCFAPDSEYAALEAVLNIADFFADKQFIIKIHPFDPVDINNLIRSKLDKHKNVFVTRRTDIITVIEGSSIVITSNFSSATLDAIILDKPVISLNLYKRGDLVPFVQRGVAINAASPQELHQAVKRIFAENGLKAYFRSNRPAFIRDYAYKIDGNSTKRIIGLIRALYNDPGS